MKRILGLALFLLCAAAPGFAQNYPLNQVIPVLFSTYDASFSLHDADATPTCSTYSSTTTAVHTSNATTFGAGTGKYIWVETLSAANGYAAGVAYQVQCTAAVASVTGVVAKSSFRVLLAESVTGAAISDAKYLNGTTQTARDLGASVLISSGTGTGQLSVTSGVISANLSQILGTALTETSGQLAGGFKKFFNVASPTGTLNSLPGAIPGASTGLLISGTNAGTTTLGALTVTGALTATGGVAGNITGSLSGSVGSVTGAVGSVTANVGVSSLTAAAIANFFNVDSGTTYSAAVTGSVVKQIANNAGGAGFTVADIVNGVWNEARSSHVASGTFGQGVASVQGNVTGSVASVTGGATLTNQTTSLAATTAIQAKTDQLTFSIAGKVNATAYGLLLAKNVAHPHFLFDMVLASDGKSPAPGLTITCTRTLDGAAFAGCSNSVVEVGSGWYYVNLAAGDLNADEVGLKLDGGVSANLTKFKIVTQAQ